MLSTRLTSSFPLLTLLSRNEGGGHEEKKEREDICSDGFLGDDQPSILSRLALLSKSRQVYSEAENVLYTANYFYLEVPMPPRFPTLDAVSGPELIRHVRSLEISFRGWYYHCWTRCESKKRYIVFSLVSILSACPSLQGLRVRLFPRFSRSSGGLHADQFWLACWPRDA